MRVKLVALALLLTIMPSCIHLIHPHDISIRNFKGVHFSQQAVQSIYVGSMTGGDYTVENLDMFLRCFYVMFSEVYGDDDDKVLSTMSSTTILLTEGPWKVKGVGTDSAGALYENPLVSGVTLDNGTIIIKRERRLYLTSLAHELTHLALGAKFGDMGFEHNDNPIWKVGAETVIFKTNVLFKLMIDGE